jgi:hypothetical protein
MTLPDPVEDIFRTKIWVAGSVQEILETNFNAADPVTGLFKIKFRSPDSVQVFLGSKIGASRDAAQNCWNL